MDKLVKKQVLEDLKKKTLQEQESKQTGMLEIASTLLHSVTQAHIFHLQTTSNSSYAEHIALGTFYDEIDGLVDSLIESCQGKHGIIKGYKNYKLEDYQDVKQVITYLEGLEEVIETNRKSIKESYLQNQLDSIEELINSTLYKLKYLK